MINGGCVLIYWVGILNIKTLENKPRPLFEEPLKFFAHGRIIGDYWYKFIVFSKDFGMIMNYR